MRSKLALETRKRIGKKPRSAACAWKKSWKRIEFNANLKTRKHLPIIQFRAQKTTYIVGHQARRQDDKNIFYRFHYERDYAGEALNFLFNNRVCNGT